MISRYQAYQSAKRAAASLGIQLNVKWPKGSGEYWRSERETLLELRRLERQMQRDREQEAREAHAIRMRAVNEDLARRNRERAVREQARRYEDDIDMVLHLGHRFDGDAIQLFRDNTKVIGPGIMRFVFSRDIMLVFQEEQLRELFERYMIPGVRYRFTFKGQAARVQSEVFLGCSYRPYYNLRTAMMGLLSGEEYGQLVDGGLLKVYMIGAINENPDLVGQRATLTDTNCAIQVVMKYMRQGDSKDAKTIRKKVQAINEKYYETGIDNEGLQALANATQMRLVVSDRLGYEWHKFDVLKKDGTPIKGHATKVVYMVAHNNHIEEDEEIQPIWSESPEKAIAQNSAAEIVPSNLGKMRGFYNDTLDLKDKEIIFYETQAEIIALAQHPENNDAKVLLSKGMPVAVINAAIHKLKFKEHEKYPQAFTAGGVGKLKFLAQHERFRTTPKNTNLLQIAKDADISGFYLRTGESSEKNYKFDMNAAYKSFKNSGLFRGFPNLTKCYAVGKSFEEFCPQLNERSLGLLYVDTPAITLEGLRTSFESHNEAALQYPQIYYEGPGWYPVEIVQEHHKNHPELNPHIKYYAYANDSFDVDFSDFSNDQFRAFIGKCGHSINMQTWTTSDPVELARARYILGAAIRTVHVRSEVSGGNLDGLDRSPDGMPLARMIYTITFESNRPAWSCPIISAYVKAHQKFNLFSQYNKVVAAGSLPIYIAIDGIEIAKDLGHLFDHDQWKREKIAVQRGSNMLIKRTLPGLDFLSDAPDWVPPRTKSSRLQYIAGSGGTGKTEHILNLRKSIPHDVLYLAPTHDACQVLIERGEKLGIDISEHTLTYHRAFGFGCKPFAKLGSYGTIILDECSMINAEDLTKILGCVSDAQELILSGDFGQLSPVAGTPLYSNGEYHEVFKNFEITELTKNWRQQLDPEFFEICQTLRRPMTPSEAESVLEKLNARVMKDSGCIGGAKNSGAILPDPDTIQICGVNAQVDAVNAMHAMEVGSRIIMAKTLNDTERRTVANGQIGTIECLEPPTIRFDGSRNAEPSIFKCVNPAAWLKNSCKLAYAITIHKAQGKTIANNLVINPTRMFAKNHLYVALTRATELRNIFLTDPITYDVLARTCTIRRE